MSGDRPGPRRVGSILRALLRFYPERFRRRYGPGLLDLYGRLYRASPRGLRLFRLGRITFDAAWHGTAARFAERRRGHRACGHRACGRGGRSELGFGQDLRFALRQLRRHPSFTAVAVLAIGLGAGANVALYSVVSGVYFHPLPYAEADRIVMIWEDQSATGGTVRSPAAPENFLEWRERATSFTALAALRNESRRLTALEQPVAPLTHLVTPNYFELLGVQPLLGRVFAARDGIERDTVMISHGLWQGPLGGDPGILGRRLELGGQPFTVIGVVPPDFHSHHVFATQPDLWLPADFDAERCRSVPARPTSWVWSSRSACAPPSSASCRAAAPPSWSAVCCTGCSTRQLDRRVDFRWIDHCADEHEDILIPTVPLRGSVAVEADGDGGRRLQVADGYGNVGAPSLERHETAVGARQDRRQEPTTDPLSVRGRADFFSEKKSAERPVSTERASILTPGAGSRRDGIRETGSP